MRRSLDKNSPMFSDHPSDPDPINPGDHPPSNHAYNLNRFVKDVANQNLQWKRDLETGEPIKRHPAIMLALIHSEVSEATEACRKDLMDDHLPHRKGVEVELADAMIRIADMAYELGLDLGGAVVEKMAYNATRADHKPKNRKKKGGKQW